jgi:hypothetical protein
MFRGEQLMKGVLKIIAEFFSNLSVMEFKIVLIVFFGSIAFICYQKADSILVGSLFIGAFYITCYCICDIVIKFLG